MSKSNHPGMNSKARSFTSMALLASMCALAWSAHACTANGNNLITVPDRVYTSFSAGDIITDWGPAGDATYLETCTPNQTGWFRFSAGKPKVATHGGYDTFSTSDPGIGLQVRYSYPRSRGLNGEPVWSEWKGLTETGEDVRVYTHIGGDIFYHYVQTNLQFRFVALADISGDRGIKSDTILQVDDLSFGTKLHQKWYDWFYLDAPRAASCWFARPPADKVLLPPASKWELNKEGALSTPATFTWSWQCNGGNLGHDGQGDFMYGAATTVTGDGRMSVTGGAKGVDLLVTTTRNGGGRYVPVKFNRWYSNDGNLGTSGTESLQVRYIRNADPDLVLGSANGGLTIQLLPK